MPKIKQTANYQIGSAVLVNPGVRSVTFARWRVCLMCWGRCWEGAVEGGGELGYARAANCQPNCHSLQRRKLLLGGVRATLFRGQGHPAVVYSQIRFWCQGRTCRWRVERRAERGEQSMLLSRATYREENFFGFFCDTSPFCWCFRIIILA